VTTSKSLKVFSEIRDLEIFDSDGELCGIADEVEFDGAPGRPLKISALLVGPGSYDNRLPRWAVALVRRIAGRQAVRVPWTAVEHVTSRITLNRRAEALGLCAVERRLRPWLQKVPFA
jgi:sporulation protein YlmC with PRC-barrel domain